MTLEYLLHEQFSIPMYLELGLRLIVACACGALIGFERSRRNKEAGIRTHIIVACASALFMIVSKYGFADLSADTAIGLLGTRGADPARIAAQIVSGISFLGAGVIFHNGNGIKGLTTAAGLWAMAGIGMAVGSGMYVLGIFCTIMITVIQIVMHRFAIGGDALYTTKIRFSVKNTPEFHKAFKEFLEEKKSTPVESSIRYDEEGYAIYNMTVKTVQEITIDDLSMFLEANGEIKSVSVVNLG